MPNASCESKQKHGSEPAASAPVRGAGAGGERKRTREDGSVGAGGERKRTREDANEPAGASARPPPIQPVDAARAAFNRACINRPQLDERGGDHTKTVVQAKTDAFCACFSPSVRVRDLGSGKEILADAKALRSRYQTVFRESGSGLQMRVLARAVFEPARGGRTAMVLDREHHASLVTPVGAMLDGALGLRGPRDQGLWALYEVDVEQKRITGAWLCPAADGATSDHLAELQASETWHKFSALADGRLGAGWHLRTGPLHSVAVGCYEMQGRRPTMEDQVARRPSPDTAYLYIYIYGLPWEKPELLILLALVLVLHLPLMIICLRLLPLLLLLRV